MQDIGYSGQYLHNKEFRLKFKTGSDIQNCLNDTIAGELLLVTGDSPAIYICTKTVNETESSDIYKITDLTDRFGTEYSVTINDSNGGTESGGGFYSIGEAVTLYASPDAGYTFDSWTVNSGGVTISNNSFIMPGTDVSITANYTTSNDDSDNDGVVDALDYFYNDEFETYTKDELDALTLDTTDGSVLAEWDIIKCLLTPNPSDQNNQGIVAGEYYLAVTDEGGGVWRVSDRDGDVLNSDNVVMRISLASRGTEWQRVIRA